MKNEKGNVLIGLIVVVGIVLSVIVVSVACYFGAVKTGNETENTIEAVWEDNENILSSFKLKVMEMAQVNTMSVEDKVKVIDSVLGGRYGKDGLKATWAWIKEQNIDVDNNLYRKLQQTFESGRNDFKVAQSKLIDVKRGYKNKLGNPWSGFWLRMANYPTLNVGYPRGTQDDYKIITNGSARKAFETGMDEVTKLR